LRRLGHRVLDTIEGDTSLYGGLDETARSLDEGIRGIFKTLDLPYAVSQLESIVDFNFSRVAARNYDDARRAERISSPLIIMRCASAASYSRLAERSDVRLDRAWKKRRLITPRGIEASLRSLRQKGRL